jgi:DNA-binding transcriptional LysR family regulator
MDTNRIRYFLSLSRTGSITGAAALHHISPAAFSKAMKVFEFEVGYALTIPHGRGLILTDSAKTLVPKLESIIEQIDAIHKQQLNQPSQKVLRLATFEVFSTYFMSRVMSDTLKAYQCEIHELIPGKMEEAVASGKADLALTYLPIPHPDLDFLKITPIEMGIFAKKKSALALPFAVPVSPIEGSPNKVQGLDGWPDDGYPREIHYRVEMLQTALNLCSEGLAVAYLPKFVAHLYNETVKSERTLEERALPRGFPKTRDAVYLIKRKSDEEGELAKKLAQAVRKWTKI